MWLEYVNTDSKEAEAIEGSFVFLGSQYGAQTKNFQLAPVTAIDLSEIKDKKVKDICQRLDALLTSEKNTGLWDYSLIKNVGDVKAMLMPLTPSADEKTIKLYRHFLASAAVSGHDDVKNDLIELIKPIWEKSMKINLKSIDYFADVDPADENAVYQMCETLDQKFTDMKEQIAQKDEQIETHKQETENAQNELKEFKNVFGDDATKETAENVRDKSNELFEMLVNETAKYGKLAGLIEGVDEKVEKFKTMSVEDLKERLDEYKVAYDKKNPSKAKNDDHPAIEYQPKENFELD
jgi:hypothetical protein